MLTKLMKIDSIELQEKRTRLSLVPIKTEAGTEWSSLSWDLPEPGVGDFRIGQTFTVTITPSEVIGA